MLSISEIKLGTVITYKDQPYVVVKADHLKMGRGGAVLKTKLKNLITGEVLPETFQQSDTVSPAEIERRKASFLYADSEQYYFMESESYEQFFLSENDIADQIKFLKEGLEVDVLKYEGKPVAVNLPIKIKYEVKEAPPGVKGDTASGASKQVVLENDLTVNAPLFVNKGDEIIVNSENGEYVERA